MSDETNPSGGVVTNTYDITTGAVSGHQTRWPDGKKKNMSGLDTKTSVFVPDCSDDTFDIGSIKSANYVFLCEGLSDAQAMETLMAGTRAMKGYWQVVGALSASTLSSIATKIDQLMFPGNQLVVVPDMDTPGWLAAASAVAKTRKAWTRVLLIGDKEGEDVRSVVGSHGSLSELGEHIVEQLEETSHIVVSPYHDNYYVEPMSGLVNKAVSNELEKHPVKRGKYFATRVFSNPPVVLGAFGLRSGLIASMVGPPSSGKSAVALAAGLAMASCPVGEEDMFGGESITGGAVLWIASEGEHSLPSRVAAWQQLFAPEQYKAREWPNQFGVVTAYDSRKYGPGNQENLDKMLRHLSAACEQEEFQPKLVVLDTLAASLSHSGLDENSQAGMSSVLDWAYLAVETLRFDEKYGPAVLMVHHTGKDEDRGPRGHSSYHGALDVEIQVRNNFLQGQEYANEAKVFFSKNRYGESRGLSLFALEPGGYTDKQTGKPAGVRAVYQERFGA